MKWKIILQILLPLPLLIIPFLTPVLYKPLTVFPHGNDKYMFKFWPYNDSLEGGNSLSSWEDKTEEYMKWRYTLRDGIKYPFVGVSISFNDRYMDFTPYDSVRIKVDSVYADRLIFTINTFTNMLSSRGKPIEFFPYSTEIPIWKDDESYVIRRKDLTPPAWWFEENGYSFNDFSKKGFSRYNFEAPGFSKVVDFSLCIDSKETKGQEDIVEITEITFYRSHRFLGIITGSALLLYYIILFLFRFKRNIKKITEEKSITIQYDKIEVKNKKSSEFYIISKYIGKHYLNQDLSVECVSSETGISIHRVPAVIKKQTDLTFPQYLNSIRIHEAKRLLRESDLSVLDIAYSVGYNSVSHFNRIFKKYEQCSPLIYRNSSRKN